MANGKVTLESSELTEYFESDLMHTYKHKWRIDGYSSIKKEMNDEILSPPFDVGPKKQMTWRCKFTPGGRDGDPKTFLSLFVVSYNYPGSTTYVKVKIVSVSNENTKIELDGGICKMNRMTMTTEIFARCSENISMVQNLEKKAMGLPGEDLFITWETILFSPKFINEISALIKEYELTLLNDFKNLLNSSTFADVDLITKDGQQIHAHKAILAARCPAFRKMFADSLMYGENQFQIKDMESSILKRMLDFIYRGNIENLNTQTALKLYEAADKYGLTALKSLCENQLLISGPSIEDAAEYLRVAFIHNASKKLKTQIVEFAKAKVNQIKNTVQWKELMKRHPEMLGQLLEYSLNLG